MDIERPPQHPFPAQPAPARPQQVAAPQPQVQPHQPAHQPAQPHAAGHALPFGMTQEQLEDKIEQLMGITGTDRDQAIAALRAAFFDVNTAVNYVFEGIPANAGPAGGLGNAPAPANPGPAFGGFPEAEDGGDEPVDINQEAAIQELQQIMSNPAFQQIRAQARQNPQILPRILEYFRENSPNVYQLISTNPELLQALLLGAPPGGQGGQGGRPQGNVIQITQEENDAIERVAPV